MGSIKRKILTLPYHVAFRCFQFLCWQFAKAELWTRSSFGQEYFEPLLSDLDLSVLAPNAESEKKVLKIYRWMKLLFPFLGEMAFFNSQKLAFLQKDPLNNFELDRDPVLKTKLLSSNSIPYTEAQASVYLQLALRNDYQNLTRRPARRLKKWRYHRDHVSQRMQLADLEFFESDIFFSVVSWVVSLKKNESKAQQRLLRSKVQFTLDHIANHSNLTFFSAVAEQETYMWSYFPGGIPPLVKSAPLLSPTDLELLYAQIDWELLKTLRMPLNSQKVLKTTERLKFLMNRIQPQIAFSVFDNKMSKINQVEALFLNPR